MSETPATFDEWAILEIMGHDRYAGRVTEQAIGGGSFVRVDVPAIDDRPGFSKLFGHGSIFSITPCTEEIARAAALRFGSTPLTVYGLGLELTRQRSLAFSGDDDYGDDEP